MSDNNKVEVGQVWQDNDPRVPTRTITVLSVTATHAHVVSSPSGRKTRVKLSRFKPIQTGYRLVEPGKHK